MSESVAARPADNIRKSRYYEASQWRLMWRRFSRHKVALWMLYVVVFLYAVCLNCDFFAPYDPEAVNKNMISLPPQLVRVGLVAGDTLPGFYVHPFVMDQDPVTLNRNYYLDREGRVPLRFFVHGEPWKFFGVIPTDRHFVGVDAAGGGTCFLVGTNRLGQDVLSRMLYGGRISLLLGLTGVMLSFLLGISLGGISGYYGGKIDMAIQRLAEILQTIPTIPIWMAMAAAIPKNWSSVQVYFGMTVILACIGWTGLCRVVRGKLLALREEDYARAAMLAGASDSRIIFAHLVPNFFSHIIASLTLAVPGMILAETSLSFLGLGLRPPTVSWGVLLQEANNVDAVINQPWLLLPGILVVIAVLAFNFVGEGLRDAADPYSI